MIKLHKCMKCQGDPLPEYYGNLNGESAASIECLCGRKSPICDNLNDAIECWQHSNSPAYIKSIKDLEKNK